MIFFLSFDLSNSVEVSLNIYSMRVILKLLKQEEKFINIQTPRNTRIYQKKCQETLSRDLG